MAISGTQVKLKIGTITTGIVSANRSGRTRELIPDNELGDTAKKYRQSVIFDGGTTDVTIKYVPATHAALKTKIDSYQSSPEPCEIEYPNKDKETFNAWLSDWSEDNISNEDGSDNTLQASFTLTVDGTITVVPFVPEAPEGT